MTNNEQHFSPAHQAYIKRIRRRNNLIFIIRILLIISIFGLWELASTQGWINSFIASKPSKAMTAIVNLFNRGELALHLGYTVGETVIGFTIGTLSGIIIATILCRSDFISKVVDPYIVIVNSIPKVALGPIFI